MSKPAIFKVNGRLVNARGQEVDENGKVLGAAAASDPDLQAQFETMRQERDALHAKLEAVKAIPDNALELLKTVKGIGDETAQKALDALTSGKPSDGK